jgi:hypothetical protein
MSASRITMNHRREKYMKEKKPIMAFLASGLMNFVLTFFKE